MSRRSVSVTLVVSTMRWPEASAIPCCWANVTLQLPYYHKKGRMFWPKHDFVSRPILLWLYPSTAGKKSILGKVLRQHPWSRTSRLTIEVGVCSRMSLQSIAIVGKENNPILIRNYTKDQDIRWHYVAHASLDIIEEKCKQMWHRSYTLTQAFSLVTSGREKDLYIGLLYSLEDLAV